MISKIVPDVYEISARSAERGKEYRVFLFTNGTTTLVDTGRSDTTSGIIDGIEQIGEDPERLLITHGDRDHIGGFDAIVDRYDPESWVPEQTELTTESSPTHRYTNETTIGRFLAVHAPGHEPDNHVIIDQTKGIAVMGDAANGSDRRGLPAGYFTLPSSSQDLDLALKSLEKLLDYEFDLGLVFHGTSVRENAHEKLERYVS